LEKMGEGECLSPIEIIPYLPGEERGLFCAAGISNEGAGIEVSKRSTNLGFSLNPKSHNKSSRRKEGQEMGKNWGKRKYCGGFAFRRELGL